MKPGHLLDTGLVGVIRCTSHVIYACGYIYFLFVAKLHTPTTPEEGMGQTYRRCPLLEMKRGQNDISHSFASFARQNTGLGIKHKHVFPGTHNVEYPLCFFLDRPMTKDTTILYRGGKVSVVARYGVCRASGNSKAEETRHHHSRARKELDAYRKFRINSSVRF